MEILDLFCGAGGLSYGFSKIDGHHITGVDISDDAAVVAEANDILDDFRKIDLSEETIENGYDIILGGPPCKPFSSVNTTKRGSDHGDYQLVKRFFDHIVENKPRVFLMENVPPLEGEEILERQLARIDAEQDKLGETEEIPSYSIEKRVVRYSDYGAATKRNRLIVFGIREGDAHEFFRNLEKYRSAPANVGDKIAGLPAEEDPSIKHIWPNLTTIHKYKDKYRKNKYGWYILDEDGPAPSFGNVMKTYILPPSGKTLFDDSIDSKKNPPRAISVREAALIMGFDMDFDIPEDLGIGNSYQLIVDSVSPDFSRVAARAVQDMLE